MSGPVGERPRPHRPGRGRARETFCTYCDQLVGLVNAGFNVEVSRAIPKTSRHNGRDGRLCPGGQLAVSPRTVMDVRRLEEAS